MPPVKSRLLTAVQILLLVSLALSILRAPADACALASLALKLWFEKMIPSLFPFMVLSGLIVRLDLGSAISLPFYPLLGRLYRMNKTMCTTLLLGFLFGFPLGAKTVAEQYSLRQLSKPQAQYLLSFCNNIGPVYLLGFALPLLGISGAAPARKAAAILVFFALPLLCGLILRHTVYRGFSFHPENLRPDLRKKPAFIPALDASVTSACEAITRLGGYMVFFIVCNLPVSQLTNLPTAFRALIAPTLEVTSGLALSKDALPVWLSMAFLTFGGLSCFAQTYTCVRDTDLSFRDYCLHKLLQTAIAICLYALLFSVFSGKPPAPP